MSYRWEKLYDIHRFWIYSICWSCKFINLMTWHDQLCNGFVWRDLFLFLKSFAKVGLCKNIHHDILYDFSMSLAIERYDMLYICLICMVIWVQHKDHIPQVLMKSWYSVYIKVITLWYEYTNSLHLATSHLIFWI